ncbi:MAG: type II secretion system protein [Verrucomicrobiales bacterium]
MKSTPAFFPRSIRERAYPQTMTRVLGFTLVELLVVISIIAVLMGILFPVVSSVQQSARRAQAKNDAVQIANSVNAYNTEYSMYPSLGSAGSDYSTPNNDNKGLMDVLRGIDTKLNRKAVVFLDAPIAKEVSGRVIGGVGTDGVFYDPWGRAYQVRYDANYDNEVDNPFSNAGPDPLRKGVISWSGGREGKFSGDLKTAGAIASWN